VANTISASRPACDLNSPTSHPPSSLTRSIIPATLPHCCACASPDQIFDRVSWSGRHDFTLNSLGYSSDPAADLAVAGKASDRLTAIDPNNLLALRTRATLLRARGDWPTAEAVVRGAIELQPTEAMRHYKLGVILMAEGRHQEALQGFRDARRFAGGSDSVYLFDANITMANLAIGHLADAIAVAPVSKVKRQYWAAILNLRSGERTAQAERPLTASASLEPIVRCQEIPVRKQTGRFHPSGLRRSLSDRLWRRSQAEAIMCIRRRLTSPGRSAGTLARLTARALERNAQNEAP
jgi:tetratricopeptide (TPR) repeat protein